MHGANMKIAYTHVRHYTQSDVLELHLKVTLLYLKEADT